MVLISPRRARARSESGWYVGNGTGDLARGGGRSLNGIWYPSRRTDTTQGSAPIADHCRQWCDRHPPYMPRRGDGVSWSAFRTLCLSHRSCRNGCGLGEGSALVAALVRLVSCLRGSLVVITRRLLLTGS